MKILHVTPYYYPAWAYGGIPRVVYELSREMARMGHDVTVYTTDVFDQDRRYDQGSGRVVDVEGVKVHYFRNLGNRLAYHFQLYFPEGMCRTVRESIAGFDMVHLHGHRNFLNTIVHHYARKAGRGYVLSGHGTALRIERRYLQKQIYDRLIGDREIRDAGHFVAVSEHEVRQYAEMGIDAGKVTVIYNGIDVEASRSLPEAGAFRRKYGLEGRKVVLYLGKISPRKGVDFLVRSFSCLADAAATLVIAGNDLGFREQVEEIIGKEGISGKVLFTGLLTGADKLSAYRDADVVVYPAIHEIFGLVPFEALMCGAPVIVTDDCGCGDIIGREEIGYLVKYNDIAGLRDMLEKVLAGSEEARSRVRKGREFIMNNLNWSVIGDKYISLYRRLLSGAWNR